MDKKSIQKELLYLGFKPNVLGFEYIATAIEIYDIKLSIIDLYKQIAEKYNTTALRVERAIRYSKENAFKTSDITERMTRYGVNIPNTDYNNGEFIALMNFALKDEHWQVFSF